MAATTQMAAAMAGVTAAAATEPGADRLGQTGRADAAAVRVTIDMTNSAKSESLTI